MKVIIIGSIAAGVSAAKKITAGDSSAKICVYEKGSFYTCGNCGLPHYLNESLDALFGAIGEKEYELKKQGIEAHLMHEVLKINPSAHEITVNDLGSQIVFTDTYDKLVIATGSRNLIPDVEGSRKVGVQVLKSVEDVIFLKEFTKTPYVKDICIIGGSYAGLEIAKAFVKMNRNVRIIERNPHLLPEFDIEVSDQIQNELAKAGVEFTMGADVRRFTGRTFVETVETSKGSFACDLCIVSMGVKPNTEIVAGTGMALDKNSAVLIDETLKTSIEDIYAVGDCAVCSNGNERTSSLHAAGLEVARTGLTEEEAKRSGIHVKSVTAKGTDRPGICPNANSVSVKLIYEASTRQVVGAQAWGKKNAISRINAVAVAVKAGMTVEQLGKVDFVYSSSESSIWDPISVACYLAK